MRWPPLGMPALMAHTFAQRSFSNSASSLGSLALVVMLPVGCNGALSVAVHSTEAFLMEWRGSVTVTEQDLTGPWPPRICSSVDEGPYCGQLSELSAGPGPGSSAPFLVDGMFFERTQALNKGAFANWENTRLETPLE
ncbi:unnamed protein product, partial [Prorocentrum cordatum]